MASAPPSAGSSSMGMIIPAAISGAASLGGAAMGGKAANKAAKLQSQSTDKALAFQREQEASRKANYDKAYNMWLTSRNQLLERYGLPTMGEAPMAGPQMTSGGAPIPSASVGLPARPAMNATNLGELIQMQPQAEPQPGVDWLPQLPGRVG